MKFFRWLFLCAFFVNAGPASSATGSVAPEQPKTQNSDQDFTLDRLAFWEAGRALKAGDIDRYTELLDSLGSYPLVGYLHFDYLKTRLGSASEAEVRDFLTRNADSPLSVRLRAAWLDLLARQGRWDSYLSFYQPSTGKQGTKFQCQNLQARYRSAPTRMLTQDWLDETKSLWLVGEAQPDECDALFSIWRGKGHLSQELVWQRIALAMDKRQPNLASHLAKQLDDDGQALVARWQRMDKNPEDVLNEATLARDTEQSRDIMQHGIKRLAKEDALQASNTWKRLKPLYKFTADDAASTDREIAMAAGRQRIPQALDWLSAVNLKQVDGDLRELRVRTAVIKQDWPAVITWTGALQGEESEKGDWRYWQARALEQVKQSPAQAATKRPSNQELAKHIYTELAKERTYYGFLANDRLGKPYDIKSRPIAFTQQEMASFKAIPSMVRVQELGEIGLTGDQFREWEHALKIFSPRELELAAVLANRWGWVSRAIFTSAKANHRDDLELRFPTLFRSEVAASAKENALDPAWVFGVIRQESAFSTDARSSAGALGLMQLMPATGRATARSIGAPIRNLDELLEADTNIQLGSAYLRQVLDANGGNQVLATASYNAGPGRVRQWLPDYEKLPADVWVEAVPFTETRNYVQQVLAFTTIFSHRLGQKIVPLRARMPDIYPLNQ